MHSFLSFCSVLILLALFLCILQVFNMFHHRSLGIRINIRVTKLVLLHSRPVSHALYSKSLFIYLFLLCMNCFSLVILSPGQVIPEEFKLEF